MITDPHALASIRGQWYVVERFCEQSHRQSMLPSGDFINETPPESFYNLPLILAFAVFDQVLENLIDQGDVPHPSGRRILGARKESARSPIAWQNYALVESGKDERNKIAHEGKLLSRETCLLFINAIRTELSAWRIL